jgi:hypothetical protein
MNKAIDQTWRLQARCRGLDTNLFFFERGESSTTDTALEYCNGGTFHNRDKKGKLLSVDTLAPCPVRTECLEFALSFENDQDTAGIFGGVTPNQRRKLRADRAKAPVAEASTSVGLCPRCNGTGLHVSGSGRIYQCQCGDGLRLRVEASV